MPPLATHLVGYQTGVDIRKGRIMINYMQCDPSDHQPWGGAELYVQSLDGKYLVLASRKGEEVNPTFVSLGNYTAGPITLTLPHSSRACIVRNTGGREIIVNPRGDVVLPGKRLIIAPFWT